MSRTVVLDAVVTIATEYIVVIPDPIVFRTTAIQPGISIAGTQTITPEVAT